MGIVYCCSEGIYEVASVRQPVDVSVKCTRVSVAGCRNGSNASQANLSERITIPTL
jgi:hypothetical protein